MSLVADDGRQYSGGMSLVANVVPLSVLERQDSGGMSLVTEDSLLWILKWQASGGMRLVADVCLQPFFEQ